MVEFVTCPPPAGLAHAVREMWQLRDAGMMHAGLPKPWVEIVVSLRGIHWWRASPGCLEHRYSTGWVTPIQDGARHARSVGERLLIGARVEPWAARRWLGELPPGDGTPPPRLQDVIGREAPRLRRRLLSALPGARFEVFATWLAAQPGLAESPGDNRFASSVDRLARNDTRTAGTLRRRFARHAGIAPKRWLILRRLDGVLRDARLADPGVPLAHLAIDHGFADQAHLTREMRRFTGATPGTFRGRSPAMPPHMLACE